ncbi:phage tail-collar fiber domain-containing protein [Geovibrio ferrireducens]|uniref:phage tail-collar fiber domain-containing protein n=1 Tax=Geovibrio ferrireducens TaxID=46201 RepID=UPI00224597D4|nr:phage tail protein [Geovibrio ferrireducens]
MAEFKTILTNIGLEKMNELVANGGQINFTHFAVGDSNGAYYEPSESQTALENEVWRTETFSVTIQPNNRQHIKFRARIPENVGGFTVREAAVFDDEGDLIYIAKYPEKAKPLLESGATSALNVTIIGKHSNASEAVVEVLNVNDADIDPHKVRAATTAHITLSGLQTVDGVSLSSGDRVLVKNQSTASSNGIYTAASGAWARAVDFNNTDNVLPGSLVSVVEGTANGGYLFQNNTPGPITIGSTALNFHAFERKDNLKEGAYRDVISGVTDIDPAKLIPNGAYGIGPAPLNVSNLNMSMTAGIWFTYDSSATNKPSEDGGCGFMLKRSDTVSIQVAFPDDGGIYYRPRTSGVWSSTWIRVAAISDIPSIPAATTTNSGVVELATQAEVEGRTDDARAVTPASLMNFLLKGDYGFGSEAIDLYVGDLNEITETSIVWVGSAATNKPGSVGGYCMTFRRATTNLFQLFINQSGTEVVYRVKNTSWGNWSVFFTASNQLTIGTTPASARAALGLGTAATAGDASTTAKGIVELATTAESAAGVDAVRAVTPAGLAAFLSNWLAADEWQASKTTNGYQKLPSGLIFQWGTVGGASATISFPIVFPVACVSLSITPFNNSASGGGSGSVETAQYGSVSSSGFFVTKVAAGGDGYTGDIKYIAIGY